MAEELSNSILEKEDPQSNILHSDGTSLHICMIATRLMPPWWQISQDMHAGGRDAKTQLNAIKGNFR